MRPTQHLLRAFQPLRVTADFTLPNLHSSLVFTPARSLPAGAHHWSLDSALIEQLGFHPDHAEHLRRTRPTRPTVLLLGWWGASVSNLNHYRELYSDLGYDSLCHVAPVRDAFVPRRTIERCWRLLHTLDAFRRTRPGDLKIVVHGMSNNGAYNTAALGALIERTLGTKPRKNDGFLYTGHATDLLLARLIEPHPDFSQLRRAITGVILDSAPSAISPRVMARAASIIFTHSAHPTATKYGLPASKWTSIFEAIFGIFMRRSSTVAGMDGLLFPAMDRMPFLYPEARFLFLYSHADALVPAEEVLEFARHVQDLGARADAVEFKGTGHVAHYRGKHKEKYARAVGSFLKACTQGNGRGANFGMPRGPTEVPFEPVRGRAILAGDDSSQGQ